MVVARWVSCCSTHPTTAIPEVKQDMDGRDKPGPGELRAGKKFSKNKLPPPPKQALSFTHPAHRGAPLERRLDGGAGRRRAWRFAFKSGSRRPAIPGLGLGRRPRTRFA